MGVQIVVKSFAELTNTELYDILKLRSEVFVVEQKIIYEDIDGKDPHTYHLMCRVEDRLAGYTRLLPAGISYEEVSIGRVVISKDFRGTGLGRQMMEESVKACNELFGEQPIRICAQSHLTRFYNSIGFVEVSDSFDHEGIPHTLMLRVP